MYSSDLVEEASQVRTERLAQQATSTGILVSQSAPTAVPSGTTIPQNFPTVDINLVTGVVGVLAAVNGGTGQSSYAIGDIPYASAATVLSKLADIATGNALI